MELDLIHEGRWGGLSSLQVPHPWMLIGGRAPLFCECNFDGLGIRWKIQGVETACRPSRNGLEMR